MRLSFFTVHCHSDMRAFVDEKEIGKMPVSCEVTEGDHLITIKHLTNFRWKKIQFRIKVNKHMDITAKFNPFWGTVKVYVDGERVHYSKK